MANCEQCNTEFESKRASAKYCSTKCRVAANRDVPKPSAITDQDRDDFPDLENIAKRLQISEEEYIRRIKVWEAKGVPRIKWLTTGIPELDDFQRIPKGRITQIQGPSSAGKTTLVLNMIKGLKDKRVLYIDTEATLNPELNILLGLDSGNVEIYDESTFLEDVYEKIVEAAKSGKYEAIILDSLAATTTVVEEMGKAGDANIGQKAKIMNKLTRILPQILKDNGTAFVVINQEREVIGGYVPQKYTPGGMGVIYACSLILGIRTIPSWRFPKDAKNGLFKGHEIEVRVIKSKVSTPHRITKVKLYYPNPVAHPELVYSEDF